MNAINCPECQTPNRPEAKFCSRCGQLMPGPRAAVGLVCRTCGKPNRPDAKFCLGCGNPLSAAAVAQTPAAAHIPPPARPGQPASPGYRQAASRPQKNRTWQIAAIGFMALLVLCGCLAAGGTGVWVFKDRLFPTQVALRTPEQDTPTRTSLPATWTPTPTLPPTATHTPTATPVPTDTPVPTGTPIPTSTERPSGPIGASVGSYAPDFTLVDAITDEDVSLSQFLGQPVMVNFWATWCPYCVDEMPDMQIVYDRHQEAGLVILAVDTEETRSEVRNFQEDYDFTFNLLLDFDGDVTQLYEIEGWPTTYFLNRDGKIVAVQLGSMDEDQMEEYLELILK